MESSFDRAFAAVVGVEGGYSDAWTDPGNWTGGAPGRGICHGTKYGISAAAFPTLDIRNLTLTAAKAIYRCRYWDRVAGDLLPGPVALETFDCAVNQGVSFAARTLQAAAGATEDGVIGPVTLEAVRRRAASALVVEFAARRAVRYAAGDMARFGLGWMRRLMRITAQALA